MSINEDIPFDPLIWDPDIIGLLGAKFPDRQDSTVITSGEAARQNKIEERQPTPMDWLISRRDSVLAELAQKWVASDDEHTPLKFIQTIWSPLFEAVFNRAFNGQTGEEFALGFAPTGTIAQPPKTMNRLMGGLVSCLDSMVTLEAGDVENTLDHLEDAMYTLGIFEGERRQRASRAVQDIDFSKLGTDKRHAENREMKAQALKYYAEHGHLFTSMAKAAKEISKKIVPMDSRTVAGWLSEDKKKKINPGKVPY